MKLTTPTPGAFLMLLFWAQNSHACSMCFYGDPSQSATKALRIGVLTLLGFLAVVLSCLIKFLVGFTKKAKALDISE